jgi:hypothetical protein
MYTKEILDGLDLPVLKSLYYDHVYKIGQACLIARSKIERLQLLIEYSPYPGPRCAPLSVSFGNPPHVPEEFKKAFEDYATRLCAERHLIEVAISDKSLEEYKTLDKD